jgi:hypothetical protein
MKLGLFATLTGLAVALAATKRKQPRPLPATTGKTTTPQARRSPSPVTGTAPQEGTEAPALTR